jgi:hypothetical protein
MSALSCIHPLIVLHHKSGNYYLFINEEYSFPTNAGFKIQKELHDHHPHHMGE